jgi:hypothetical protein
MYKRFDRHISFDDYSRLHGVCALPTFYFDLLLAQYGILAFGLMYNVSTFDFHDTTGDRTVYDLGMNDISID